MKQILVATDFSVCAANAMKYAMKLAKVLNASVCVIHAIPPTAGINNNIYNAIFIESYYKNKRAALQEWAEKFSKEKKYKDIKVTTLGDVGFLKAVLLKYIKRNPVELLVMGITGSTGITGIVGSNASLIVNKIKIPTLIVPLESKFAKVPVVTLATDYQTRLSSEDVNALNVIIKAFGCKEMQVLYVDEKPDIKSIETGETKLKNLIKRTELKFNYLPNSSPLNGIMDFIAINSTDLICLVKHHHNIVYRLFSRSTVNQVMNRSVKAILVLHE